MTIIKKIEEELKKKNLPIINIGDTIKIKLIIIGNGYQGSEMCTSRKLFYYQHNKMEATISNIFCNCSHFCVTNEKVNLTHTFQFLASP